VIETMKPEYIILHHSLTKDSKTVSWTAIRRYHVETLGWRDIGYHIGIEDINGIVEAIFGRVPDRPGAHCKQAGMNKRSIGVCFVGNFDEAPPSQEMWDKGLQIVSYFCKRHGIPIENVLAHRDYATYKTCPGLMFDMAKFRMDLEPLLPETYIHGHSIEPDA